MAGLRKAWKTRRASIVGNRTLGGDGFPSASLSPLEIAQGDSHIPTAPTTTLFLGDTSSELSMGTLLSSLDN